MSLFTQSLSHPKIKYIRFIVFGIQFPAKLIDLTSNAYFLPPSFSHPLSINAFIVVPHGLSLFSETFTSNSGNCSLKYSPTVIVTRGFPNNVSEICTHNRAYLTLNIDMTVYTAACRSIGTLAVHL